jgi:hypothetical protein
MMPLSSFFTRDSSSKDELEQESLPLFVFVVVANIFGLPLTTEEEEEDDLNEASEESPPLLEERSLLRQVVADTADISEVADIAEAGYNDAEPIESSTEICAPKL